MVDLSTAMLGFMLNCVRYGHFDCRADCVRSVFLNIHYLCSAIEPFAL